MQEYFFRTEQLAVGYQGIPLIREIGIHLKKGKILTLIGPNGVGKTTILKTIANQLSPLTGAVYLDQEVLNKMTERETAKRVSLVLTERIRPELMTCEEVVAMGRYPYTGMFGLLTKEDKEKVQEAMKLVHISELRDKDFMTLSDGQKQRVMLARALCQEPELLILDEPTSYLDIRYKLEFLSVLQKMTREKKLTVILSLHELDLAQRVSDQLLCIRDAYVERLGTPEQIFDGSYIRDLYDMEEYFFDEHFGMTELLPVKGKAMVFVIAGGGSGICFYRELQRKGIPFITGILWENDIDYPAAQALSERVIFEKAFCRITTEVKEKALMEIDNCPYVVCCLEKFSELNSYQQELQLYAAAAGKLIDKEAFLKKFMK